MGTVSKNSERKHKQSNSGQYQFHTVMPGLSTDLFNRVQKMSEMKFMIGIVNLLGYSLTGLFGINWMSYLLKINDLQVEGWKFDVLWMLIMLFWIQKIVFGAIKSLQDVKNRNLSLRKKEHDTEKEIEEDSL